MHYHFLHQNCLSVMKTQKENGARSYVLFWMCIKSLIVDRSTMFYQWLFSFIFCYCLPTCKLICGLPCSKGWPSWLPHFIFCSALPCNEIFYYAENCVLAIWNLFQDNSTWLSNTYSFIMVHRFFIVMWLMAEVHHLLVQVPQPKNIHICLAISACILFWSKIQERIQNCNSVII